MVDYEERFVAFVDILGFKDLIMRSSGLDRSIMPIEIKEALQVPNPAEAEQILIGRIGDISASGHLMNAFSDCVAITVLPTEQGFLHLLHHVAKIGFRLIRMKTPMFCRGGIARGLVYHDGQVIFGPAMNEAYELESRNAKFPRVILSQDVSRFGLSVAPPVDKIFKRFVRKDDEDGVYFVNILRVLRMIMDCEEEPPEDIRGMCEGVAKHLLQEIDRLYGEEREKVLWFKKYFDWARDRSAWEVLKQPYPRPLN